MNTLRSSFGRNYQVYLLMHGRSFLQFSVKTVQKTKLLVSLNEWLTRSLKGRLHYLAKLLRRLKSVFQKLPVFFSRSERETAKLFLILKALHSLDNQLMLHQLQALVQRLLRIALLSSDLFTADHRSRVDLRC